MKKDLRILATEAKQKKDGSTYTRVQTSEGWMSCFDADVSAAVANSVDKTLELEVVQVGNFWNIKKLYKESDVQIQEEKVKNEPKSAMETDGRSQSMYTSYAKDVFIALLEHTPDSITEDNTMQEAIKLVKQAREAFK